MTVPGVTVKVTLSDTQFRTELGRLARAIEIAIGNAFRDAAKDTGLKEIEDGIKKVATAAERGQRSTRQLSDGLQKVGQEARRTGSAVSELEKRQKELNATQARTFVGLLQTVTAEQKFTAELLKQAQAAGANAQALQRIATATGAFSQQELAAAANVARLKTDLIGLTTQIGRTEGAETRLAAKTKELSAAQVKLNSTQKQVTQGLRETNKQATVNVAGFGRLQTTLAKFNNVMAAVRNVVFVVQRALVGLFNVAKQGAVISQTAESFENFATNIIGIPDLLDQLRSAARGTISDLDLMKESLTLVSGLAPELARTFSEALVGAGDFETSLIEVARAAQILNPSLGDVDFFLKSLSIGIKRNERRWIDNLGIVISAREAYERFAAESGKAADELTATEKNMAVLNETLRVGSLLIDQVGDSTESAVDPFSRLEAGIANITDAFKVWLAEALGPTVAFLAGDYRRGVDAAIQANVDLARSTELTREEQLQAARDFAARVQALDVSPGEDAGLITGFILDEKAAKEQAEALEVVVREFAILAESAGELGDELTQSLGGDARNALIDFLTSLGETSAGAEQLEEIGLSAFNVADPVSRMARVTQVSTDQMISAVFELTEGFRKAAAQTKESEVGVVDFAEEIRKLSVEFDNLADEALPKQLKLLDEFGKATDDIGRAEAVKALRENFSEFGVELAQVSGFSQKFLEELELGLGLVTQEEIDLRNATRELNDVFTDLFIFFATSGRDDVDVLANAILALELGLASTASGAVALAENQQFVEGTLRRTAEAAEGEAESLEEAAEATKLLREETEKLQDSLADIVASGFKRAESAIADYAEAQRGIAANLGEERRVIVDNSAAIAAIDEELFADLSEDRKDELLDQLNDLRDTGQEFSDAYALLLRELNQDLSQSERDELLLERFELIEQQGSVIDAIFGRDKKALEGFQEDAQEAIQELIDIRRETVLELLAERGLDFEGEVELRLQFGLIDNLEAELLLKEEQFFAALDAIFGAGAVFEVGGAVIDVGQLILDELDSAEIDAIIAIIEEAVGAGGKITLESQLAVKLVAAEIIDVEQLPMVLETAFAAATAGVAPEIAIALSISPDFRTQQELDDARNELDKLTELGEEPTELEFRISEFDQLVQDITSVDAELAKVENEGEEREISFFSNAPDTEAEVNSLADAINSIPEQVTTTHTLVTEETDTAPPPAQPPAPPRSGIPRQQGGFTGFGPPNQRAGDVHFQEFVVNEPATRRIGVDNLEALQAGTAFVLNPNMMSSIPQNEVSTMLAAALAPSPTLAPAVLGDTITNNRTTTVDNSRTTINNYFEGPARGAQAVPDFYG